MVNMTKGGDLFEVHPMVKQATEQAAGGSGQYFDFLRKTLVSFSSGGTDLREKLKGHTDQNISSMQEFLRSLSGAKDFQDVVRLQIEFMHSQLNAFSEQAKGFAEAYTKPADASKARLTGTDEGPEQGFHGALCHPTASCFA
jgi:hypothetical protein